MDHMDCAIYCACADFEYGMADIQKVIASAFSAADEGNKGYLTKEDYKVAVINLSGYKPSKYEVDTAWRGARQGEGLTLSQFVELMLPRLKEKDISEEIRKIFMAFDRFCHGFISLEDCIAAFNKVHCLIS